MTKKFVEGITLGAAAGGIIGMMVSKDKPVWAHLMDRYTGEPTVIVLVFPKLKMALALTGDELIRYLNNRLEPKFLNNDPNTPLPVDYTIIGTLSATIRPEFKERVGGTWLMV